MLVDFIIIYYKWDYSFFCNISLNGLGDCVKFAHYYLSAFEEDV